MPRRGRQTRRSPDSGRGPGTRRPRARARTTRRDPAAASRRRTCWRGSAGAGAAETDAGIAGSAAGGASAAAGGSAGGGTCWPRRRLRSTACRPSPTPARPPVSVSSAPAH